MERQFLAASLLFLIALSSCQSNPAIVNNMDTKCTKSSIDSECHKNVVISIEKPPLIAENVWEYMIINNNYDHNVTLDKKTLGYINNHLNDVDKFNEFLGKSYYFIYYVIQELEAADLPPELALIPFVESNYDPFGVGHSSTSISATLGMAIASSLKCETKKYITGITGEEIKTKPRNFCYH